MRFKLQNRSLFLPSRRTNSNKLNRKYLQKVRLEKLNSVYKCFYNLSLRVLIN